MFLKQLLPISLISITIISCVHASGPNGHIQHDDQHPRALIDIANSDMLSCINNEPFSTCCPNGADPNDPICTGLTCVDVITEQLLDVCDCAQLDRVCSQLGPLKYAVPNTAPFCSAVDNCCFTGSFWNKRMVTNEEFNTCMNHKLDNGLEHPDPDLVPCGGPSGTCGLQRIVDYVNEVTTTSTSSTVTAAAVASSTTAASSEESSPVDAAVPIPTSIQSTTVPENDVTIVKPQKGIEQTDTAESIELELSMSLELANDGPLRHKRNLRIKSPQSKLIGSLLKTGEVMLL